MEFPPLLFAAIRQVEVGVVVLSEEFFWKTKWPMLELVEMMRVRKRSRPSMFIVPVFFGISRQVCRNSDSQERWMEKWEEWAKKDERINLDEWKSALKIFGSTTALSLKKEHGEISLRKEIVDAVCLLVLPESRWDDSNVEGKDRLCKVISDKVGLEAKVKDRKVRVVGLYGVGGIGKTTICKVLCNKLFQQFRGRVCHTELKSASEVALLQEALKILTDMKHDVLERVNIDKCKDQLRRCIVKQPIFLAIDNVDENSAEQANTYLGVKDRFGTGSVVVVTSRSLGQLEALNIHKNDCLGMPELEECEATDLFRNTAKSIGDVQCELDERIISRCVQICRFKKDGKSFHYHPLALTVLGNVVRECCNKGDPTLWYSTFSKIEESFKYVEFKQRIFSILRISYDTLPAEDKMLFMDVALFMRNWRSWDSNSYDFVERDLYERLGMVHDVTKHDELKTRLEGLQKKSLLEKVGDGSTDVVMHDLWREFCVAETRAGEFAERRWVYFEKGCRGLGGSNPSGSCWGNLKRMYFVSEAGVQKFLRLCLDHFSSVEVLRVAKCLVAREPRVVDFGKMIHLKYLEISHPWNAIKEEPFTKEVKVCGLELLTSLAYLEWDGMPGKVRYAKDIGCLTNLQCLKLPRCRGKRLPDMSKLTSLRMAVFKYAEVKTITGLTGKLSNLQYLNLAHCRDLQSYPGVGNLVGLKSLDISWCGMLKELPNLGKLTNLTELKMEGCVALSVCPDLSGLVSLEKLYASHCSKLAEFPGMCNLRKLQVLDILGCPVKTSPSFDGLIALREFKASFQLLEDCPVLDNFTSLRHVEIEGWNEPGLMSIAKLAMLKSLTVDQCKVRNLRLNLRNMERLQILEFYDSLSDGISKDSRLEFSDGKSKDVCANNAYQLQGGNLCNCQTLEELEVINIPGLQFLLVSNCTLKRLRITESSGAVRLMNGNGPRDSERVSDLSDFPGLRELCVIQCPHLTSFTTAKPLSALKNLELSGCESLSALLDLSYFPHLRSLDLHDCKRLTSLTSRVPLLSLSELELTGCTGLATLPDLSNFLNLRKLNLRRCESLTSITSDKPLPAFPALKEVKLRGCRNVKALPDLANFPQLKTLDLHLCESLVSLTSSGPLLALCYLNAKRCRSLKALPDHLCCSVKLRYLGVRGSGIELSEDTVNKLLASCVELKSGKTSVRISGEDSNFDMSDEMVGDESDCDFEYEGLDEDFEDEGLKEEEE